MTISRYHRRLTGIRSAGPPPLRSSTGRTRVDHGPDQTGRHRQRCWMWIFPTTDDPNLSVGNVSFRVVAGYIAPERKGKSMISKKICMLGAFAVGKTSMVSRFVLSTFSEKYHTTIGVKVDKKVRQGRRQRCEADALGFGRRGCVPESTDQLFSRRIRLSPGHGWHPAVSTFDTALACWRRVEETMGAIPFVVVVE